MFAVFENGVITEICSGSKAPYEGRADVVDLPDDTDAGVGTRKEELTAGGYVRPIAELVALGFLAVDEYHVLEAGYIRRKTDTELIVDGHLPVPVGYKVDGAAVVPLSTAERIASGLITLQPDEALIGGEIVKVPAGWKVQDGSLVKMSLTEAIAAGVTVVPHGSVYDPLLDAIREMTARERVDAGIDVVPLGSVLDGDSIREMTQDERYLAGIDVLPYNIRIVDGALVKYTDAELDEMRYAADPEAWKEARCDEVDFVLERRLKAGFVWGDVHIPVDIGAQTAFLAQDAKIRTGSLAQGFAKTAENTYIFFTAEEWPAFSDAAFAAGNAIYKAAWDAKDAIRSSASYIEARAATDGYLGSAAE